MITVRDLCKTYCIAHRVTGRFGALRTFFSRRVNEVRALDGVSFDVPAGQLCGYIGPNGAGKSTTIKVMSGILVPDSGACTVNGHVPWRERVRYVRGIGVVFGQRTQMWWDLPVQDSFDLLAAIYRVPAQEYQRNRNELVERLSIGDVLQTPVRQLSLGQRMRCELCASLLHAPPVLFLDEPTIGLDAVSKLAVRRFLLEVCRQRGTTVILTTHDMDDIEALCDRVLLIGRGRILLDGSVQKLRLSAGGQRRLTADFAAPPGDVRLPVGATLMEAEGARLRISYNPEVLPPGDLVAALHAQGILQDVEMAAPPIEEAVARLYNDLRLTEGRA